MTIEPNKGTVKDLTHDELFNLVCSIAEELSQESTEFLGKVSFQMAAAANDLGISTIPDMAVEAQVVPALLLNGAAATLLAARMIAIYQNLPEDIQAYIDKATEVATDELNRDTRMDN